MCPVGLNAQESWNNILAAKSGIGKITRFDSGPYASKIAGEVDGFKVTNYLSPKDARRVDLFIHYGMAAAIEALSDAGIQKNPPFANRIGVNIGSGIGGLPLIENNSKIVESSGPKKISPFFIPGAIINMISGNLSIMYGLKGPSLAMVTACTTATHCIGDSARLIEYGDVDLMVAGGSEATISPLGVGGFAAARALSTRNDDPEKASRPWDSDRDGFVLGEGAGILVLEEYEHAKNRDATIYAELAGYGMSADAHHITAPSEDGEGAARCMLNAIKNSSLALEDINYINAHGTSTPLGDIAETIAIKRALGHHSGDVAVSSTKSSIGHLLGAAGGVEAVFTALAVKNQIAPPTINLLKTDPECDLDYVPNEAREMKIDGAISNSFGFGGTNGTLAFRRV